MNVSSSRGSSGRLAARLRNDGSLLTRGTTIGLLLSTTLPMMPSPSRYLTACAGPSSPSEASTCSSPFSRSSVISPRTIPWYLARISSTRCSAERRLRVPESAWLISSRVDSRLDSLACAAARSEGRGLAILSRAGAHDVLFGDRHRFQERHQRAQLGADFLDPVRPFGATRALEPLPTRGVL